MAVSGGNGSIIIFDMDEKAIEIRGLEFTYPDGTKALSDINLDVFKGESLGIIGANGAGKSTLLLHLNGILRACGGSIRILGRELNDANLSFIRRKVGVIFQDPDHQLFMPTVFDDVSFGPVNMGLDKQEVGMRVRQALEEVDMLLFQGRPAHHLSYGEKRRVSIATVLSMQPQILALDEPASNLDPEHRETLILLLQNSPATKVIAAHDLDFLRRTCSRVAILNQGSLSSINPA